MKQEIKTIHGTLAFTADIDCPESTPQSKRIGMAVKWAVENGAYLRGAYLYGADLGGADLGGAYLRGVHGVNKYIKCIQVDTYPITYTSDTMQIGCEHHTIDSWREFDDERIVEMDGKTALKWWRRNKDWIFQTIEHSPAEPTKQAEQEKAA